MLLGPLDRLIRFGLPHKADDIDQLLLGGLCVANHEILNGFGAPILQLVFAIVVQFEDTIQYLDSSRKWQVIKFEIDIQLQKLKVLFLFRNRACFRQLLPGLCTITAGAEVLVMQPNTSAA